MKYSPRPFERLLTAFITRQTKLIEDLINQFTFDATAQTMRYNPSKTEDFSFRNYPALSRAIDILLGRLSGDITRTIQAGAEWSWELANTKNDNMLSKILDTVGRSRVPESALARWNQKNLPALAAFQERKLGGMGLSDKVWAYTRGIKGDLELALDLGIGEGMSADRLSRAVRGYLREPDRLYRRVRDEKGVLHLSKNASNYHPGQGVYRSSYKNAKRLAANETNMAYRTADNERMNQIDFILGFEVHLSNNHTCLDSHGVPQPFYDICDELQGQYPKWFIFKGWHPNCYDEESEVYTSGGWKRFADVADEDLILTINQDTFDLEWSAYKIGFKSWYDGKMIHFHNISLDYLVTPEHEVLCLEKNNPLKEFKRIPAERCGKSQPIYRSSEWMGEYIDSIHIGEIDVPFSLYAEFMGYWLSDGNLGHKWEIGIAQEDASRENIYSCIEAMGMKPRYNGGKVEFNSKDWYLYLMQFGKAPDKFVPAEIKNSTSGQIQIFLDAFISCDGHIKKPRSFVGNRGSVCVPKESERVYFTSSKRMADDLGELILKIGRRPSFKIGTKAGTVTKFRNGSYATNYDSWRITECRSQTATQYSKEEIDYSGWVYDLVLEKNATMYIRRNGKCFWGSNCRCYVTTILPDQDEFVKYLAAMDENGVSSYHLEGEITDIPPQMKEWLKENEYRTLQAKSLPYFIKDNPGVAISEELADKIQYERMKDELRNEERAGTPVAKNVKSASRAYLIEDNLTANIATAMTKAREVGPEVQGMAERIAEQYGALVTPINYKSAKSIKRKCRAELAFPAQLKDTVRTTIIASSDAIPSIIRDLQSQPGFLRWKQQLPKDFLGYSGNIINFTASNGVVAEIQVNTARMIYAKENPKGAKAILGEALWNQIYRETGLPGGLGHRYYEKIRVLPEGDPVRMRLEKVMERYYSHFI